MKLSSIIITVITPLDASLQPNPAIFQPTDPCYGPYGQLMTVRRGLSIQDGKTIESADKWITSFGEAFAKNQQSDCREHACTEVFNDIKARLLKYASDHYGKMLSNLPKLEYSALSHVTLIADARSYNTVAQAMIFLRVCFSHPSTFLVINVPPSSDNFVISRRSGGEFT